MQKKLQNDLMSLAHSILEMKDNEEVIVLHQKATALCEKLSLLKLINHYINASSEEVITTKKINTDKIEEQNHTLLDNLTNNPNPLEEFTIQKLKKEEVNPNDTEEEKTNIQPHNPLSNKNLIQIPLNDRIIIVNQLFEGNQSDFNRVLSQLNSFTSKKEALHFLKKMVKPDYQWEDFEETENNLIHYISKKFSNK